MFGIDDMILYPLIGGALGGLTKGSKGALLGAGAGLGAAALPGLLGTGAASGASAPGSSLLAGGADTISVANAAPIAGSLTSQPMTGAMMGSNLPAAGAAQDPSTWSNITKYAGEAKPVLQAAQLGASIMPRQHTMQTPQIMPAQGGAQGLTSVFQQGQKFIDDLNQAQMARLQRRNQWGV